MNVFKPELHSVGKGIQSPAEEKSGNLNEQFIHSWDILEVRNVMLPQDVYRIDSDYPKGKCP